MRTFEITASSHSVQVKPGDRVEVSFTVTSKADQALMARTAVRVGEGTDSAWVTAKPERLQFSAGGTEQVTLTVAVPEGAPEGRHEIKLVVANENNPDDDWTESAPVTTTVQKPDDDEKFPWWIVAVAAAVLIVAVGGYITYRLMQRPGFREACEPGGCARDLTCTDGECLGDTGWPCFGQDDCGVHLACANEDGERPGAEADESPAPGTDREDLSSEFACRKPQPLWECEGDEECAELEQTCVSVDGANLCALVDGESCRVDLQCESTWCKDGECTEYTGECEDDSDCRDDELCKDGRCVFPVGHACSSDARCETGNCEDGICKEEEDDDGRPPINPCATIRCPPGHICVGGRCIPIHDFRELERRRLFQDQPNAPGLPPGVVRP